MPWVFGPDVLSYRNHLIQLHGAETRGEMKLRHACVEMVVCAGCYKEIAVEEMPATLCAGW